jgi:hypothetical protein
MSYHVGITPGRSRGVIYAGRKQCPQCGQEFSYTSDWGYQLGDERYCSYRCVREAEKHYREMRRQKLLNREPPKPMTDEETRTAWRMHQEGVAYAEIGRVLGRNPATVNACIRSMERETVYTGHYAEIVAAREAGESWPAIARRYGGDTGTLYYWMKREKLKYTEDNDATV